MQFLDDFDDLLVSLFIALRAKYANRYPQILLVLFYILEMRLANCCLPREGICAYLHIFGLFLDDDAEVVIFFVLRLEVCFGIEVVQERFVGVVRDGIVIIQKRVLFL